MKKLLMGSVALMTFSASILLFQFSCKKDATAQTTQPTQKNKILYIKDTKTGLSAPNPVSVQELWLMNYDGSEKQKINFTIPTGTWPLYVENATVSPDATKIFMTIAVTGSNNGDLYSMNIDGTGLTKLISGATDNSVLYHLEDAY